MKAFKKEELRALEARIHRIERPKARCAGAVTLGLAMIDSGLPNGGLPKAAVHEVTGSAGGGFAALVAGRICGEGKSVLWCVEEGSTVGLYGPGLAAFGVATERLVVVRCPTADEMLWAMEEGLREEALGLVIGEPAKPVSLTASRRLQLAAEAGGTMGLILCRGRGRGGSRGGVRGDGYGACEEALSPSAVTTRWQADSRPALGSRDTGTPKTRWQLALRRCRGAEQEISWDVEWDDATHTLALAADAGRGTLVSPDQTSQTSLAG